MSSTTSSSPAPKAPGSGRRGEKIRVMAQLMRTQGLDGAPEQTSNPSDDHHPITKLTADANGWTETLQKSRLCYLATAMIMNACSGPSPPSKPILEAMKSL